MPDTPEPQHMEALRLANERRERQTRIKRDIKDGRLHLDDVLLNDVEPADAEALASRTVEWVVRAAPRAGVTTVRKVTLHARVSPMKPIGTLTDRQRQELADIVRQVIPWACTVNGREQGQEAA